MHEEFSDIGSGFNIALYDLDIRGAGNLLGRTKWIYCGYRLRNVSKILEEAIFELQSNDIIDDDKETEYIRNV